MLVRQHYWSPRRKEWFRPDEAVLLNLSPSGGSFVTEESGMKHLKKEGIQSTKIHFVGNTMIDSVIKFLPVTLAQEPWKKYKLTKNDYCLITMHRPSNVDYQENSGNIISMLNRMSERLQIIFPIHPRTQKA